MKRPIKKSLKNSFGKSKDYIKYSNVAFRMLLIILTGVFGGIKLDEYMGFDNPIFTIVLSIVSVVGSMYLVIREITSK